MTTEDAPPVRYIGPCEPYQGEVGAVERLWRREDGLVLAEARFLMDGETLTCLAAELMPAHYEPTTDES